MTAAEVVLADGTFVRATADSDAELFWGLRGSGMPLGVVTALEFQLYPVDSVVAGFLAWDWTRIERVLPSWAAWCAEAPDEATTSFRVLHVPPAPRFPRSCAAAGWWSSTAPCSARTAGPPRSSRRCVPSPRSSTRWPGCPRRRWPGCTSSPRGRAPGTPAARC
jgi:FAD/FMN-containing dehydrogenase